MAGDQTKDELGKLLNFNYLNKLLKFSQAIQKGRQE